MSRTGPGLGTVAGEGIACGDDCSEIVAREQVVTLNAVAAAGSTFAGWSGCDSSAGAACTLSVGRTAIVLAYFELVAPPVTLTVTRTGNGSGSVAASGISCGSDCSEVVAGGSSVTLTAVAASGASFAGWIGCDNASGSTCTMTMTTPKTVIAIFDGTCTPSATRCVQGGIQLQERCSAAGSWTQELCAPWSLCAADACRVACGMISAPTDPTLCVLPIADGVNDGTWRYWNDAKVESPTFANGGIVTRLDVPAEIRPTTGERWPFSWRLAANDFAVANFRLDQFGTDRHPSFGYRARKAGVHADPAMRLFVGALSPTGLISSCNFAAPSGWAAGNCDVATPLHEQLDHVGGENTMFLGVDESGTGGLLDLLDVNYTYLTIAP